MKNFITVTEVNYLRQKVKEITINVNSIANFKDTNENFVDKLVRTILVYKDTGLVNSKIIVLESANSLKQLIINAN